MPTYLKVKPFCKATWPDEYTPAAPLVSTAALILGHRVGVVQWSLAPSTPS